MTALFGGIEAGGTKFVCAVGTGPEDIRQQTRFPTTSPDETLNQALDFFHRAIRQLGALAGLGIVSFGPVDPDPASPGFGCITTTPKPGWAYTDFAPRFQQALGVPVGFDTDVNGAALGEASWGAARGLHTFIYLTIGTGIGGGGMVGGHRMHGLIHPEMGHIRIPHDWDEDPFPGSCPFHGDCLEGLASGPAIEKRWGQAAKDLPAEHPAWELEARYLGLALSNFICTLSPQKIILGGGVMEQAQLFPRIRQQIQRLLNDYVSSAMLQDRIDEFVVPPALGNRAGVLGALALAQQSANGDRENRAS